MMTTMIDDARGQHANDADGDGVVDDGCMVDDGDGGGVGEEQLVQFVFISLLQIVTLVQQNTSGSKVKVLMRLSCID